MFSYYYPAVVTTADKCSTCHRHDFQTVIVWVINGTDVRSICLSEPVKGQMQRQRCYKGKAFDMHKVTGPYADRVEAVPMVRRMHIDDDPTLGYALYPVGPEPGSVDVLHRPAYTESVEPDDTPPCVEYALMTEAMLTTINSQPYKEESGVLIPFADDVFPSYISEAIAATMDIVDKSFGSGHGRRKPPT